MSFSGTKGYLTKPKPGVILNPLHPLSRGLVGHWLFNEGAGSRAYDISSKDNHSTLMNMPPNTQGSGWGGSKFGGGLHFDGMNDYVQIYNGGIDLVGFSSSEITISMFIKPADIITNQYITGGIDVAGDNSNLRCILLGYQDNYFNIYNDGAYPTGTASDTQIIATEGEWQHIVYNTDGTTIYGYKNGILIFDVIGDFVPDFQIDRYNIGASPGGSNLFNGSIDSVRIYNRALSAVEVKQLYQNPFCNLLQVPIRRYSIAPPPVGAIMNQFQRANIGADLYNGAIIA